MRALFLAFMIVGFVGCSTTEPYTGEERMSKASKGSLIGAAVGATAGALIDGTDGAVSGLLVGAAGGGLWGLRHDRQDAELRQALESAGVRIERRGDMIRMHMAEGVGFDEDGDAVTEDFRPMLDAVALVLHRYNDVGLLVIGHAEASESGTKQLSMDRAINVGKYLTTRDIAARRIEVVGAGDQYSDPADPADAAVPSGSNRRVVMRLMALR